MIKVNRTRPRRRPRPRPRPLSRPRPGPSRRGRGSAPLRTAVLLTGSLLLSGLGGPGNAGAQTAPADPEGVRIVVSAPRDAEASTGLFGTVRSAATGLPVEGAAVLLPGTRLGTRTDAEGRFRIVVDPPPGWEGRVEVRHPCFRTLTTRMDPSRLDAPLPLELFPPQTAEARRGLDTPPLPGCPPPPQ